MQNETAEGKDAAEQTVCTPKESHVIGWLVGRLVAGRLVCWLDSWLINCLVDIDKLALQPGVSMISETQVRKLHKRQ